MIINLETIDDPQLDAYARLTEAQLRSRLEPEKGIFIAESSKVIERALDGGMQPLSFLMDQKWIEPMRRLVERASAEQGVDLPVYVLPHDELKKLTGFELTRGALAAFRRPPLPAVEDVLAGARRVAVLEDITNFTNVGAIFRSAAALGVDAVLVTPTCCDPLYRRCVRVSMGTVFQVPWTRIGTTKEDWPGAGLELLHRLGFKAAALALSHDSVTLDDPRLKAEEKLVLVLGTEGDGLAPETIAQCDYTVLIPMQHGVDSLNVAAASAVAFWELRAR
ncbi:MAG TPA: RNA methyltransferase [Candidatus Aveggerthella excrementigallinarum]|nr:RNA methyltransferase [Candidatus Aveggerthella excrementigallinarum]